MSADLAHHVQDLGIILTTAVCTSLLSARLKQPPVLGYLLAGIMLGPYVPGIVLDDGALTHSLSELGVILLMFTIGIEFSLRKLARIGIPAGLTSVIEVGLMISLGYLAGRLFGWTEKESLFIGVCVGISSTMLVAKAFEEKKLKGGFVEVAFAVLVFEDIIAILMLAVLTAVATGGDMSAGELAVMIGKLVGFLAALLAGGLLVVPRFIRMVVKLKRAETTLIAGIAVCFAMAGLAAAAGYSVALGAFMAGMLISESGEGPKVEHLIQPLRDLFAAIFFISVGMTINPALVLENWLPVLVFTALVLGGKFIGVTVGAFLSGNGLNHSVRAGMSLAQIGEFSFIIASLGISKGATRDFLFPVAVAVSLLTSLTTPIMVGKSEGVAKAIDRWLPSRVQTFVTFYDSWIQQLKTAPRTESVWAKIRGTILMLLVDAVLLLVVLAASSVLEYKVVEAVAHRFTLPVEAVDIAWIGMTVLLALVFFTGVLRRVAMLARILTEVVVPSRSGTDKPDLGAAPRRAMMVVLELALALVVGLPLVALSQPFLPASSGLGGLALVVIVLLFNVWRSLANLQGHVRAGTELIVEMLARQAKAKTIVPGTSKEAIMGHPGPSAEESLVEAHGMLPGFPDMSPLALVHGNAAVGRTLGEINLRARTGATILSINREAAGLVLPAARERLQEGDVLTLAGPPEAITRAHKILQDGPAVENWADDARKLYGGMAAAKSEPQPDPHA
ncbi:MAG: cation:proton antiporter [Myxococcales bacterium]|nr:cation:proton antiporter [Myxococcales bacterium]